MLDSNKSTRRPDAFSLPFGFNPRRTPLYVCGRALTPPLCAIFKEGRLETIRSDWTFVLSDICFDFNLTAVLHSYKTGNTWLMFHYLKINWSQILLEQLLLWSWGKSECTVLIRLFSPLRPTLIVLIVSMSWRVYRFNANFRVKWIIARA